MNELGKYISKIRQERNLTQKELADRMHLHVTTISKWENGNSMPNLNYFEELAKALNISTAELFACREGKILEEDSIVDENTAQDANPELDGNLEADKQLNEESNTLVTEGETTNISKTNKYIKKLLPVFLVVIVLVIALAGVAIHKGKSDTLKYQIVDEFLSVDADYFGYDNVYHIIVEFSGTISDQFLQNYQHEIRRAYGEKLKESDLIRVVFVTNSIGEASLSSALYELVILPVPE